MEFEDRPQLPLTARRKALTAVGAVMFASTLIASVVAAPGTTGEGDARAGVFAIMWLALVAWSSLTVLLIVRQADLPDIATASMLVTIAPFALYALVAALDARGTDAEVNVVDAMFLGITMGGLTSLVVWAIAMGIARLLRLPTTAGIEGSPPPR
jgi:hypothetical protein